MVKVFVGNDEMDWKSIDQHWLCNQISRRRDDGQEVCVRVRIEEPNVNLALSTPGWSSFGGGGRPPNHREREVIDLWDKLHLNERQYTCGNVNAFLQQLHRFV